jgi:predicted signal transduction protein with EAL and GGDEF domain
MEAVAAALRRASPQMLLLAVGVVLVCWCAARALEWAWWRPRRLGITRR